MRALGEAIDDAELAPTLGGLIGIEPAPPRFVLSQQSRTTISGYCGPCEDDTPQ